MESNFLSTSGLIPLVLFMALVLAASLHGLAASGHFPQPRAAAAATGVAPIVLFGSMVLVIASVIAGLMAALHLVAWYAAIIGGGMSVLAAPLALQWFPDRFVDRSGALVVFGGASAVLAILLIAMA
jgi:hypothetical protein